MAGGTWIGYESGVMTVTLAVAVGCVCMLIAETADSDVSKEPMVVMIILVVRVMVWQGRLAFVCQQLVRCGDDGDDGCDDGDDDCEVVVLRVVASVSGVRE